MPELELAVSATTRERRPGEDDGREYWFISDEEFDERLESEEFLERVEFPWGQRSGTLRSEIDRIADSGRVPHARPRARRCDRGQETVPNSVTIFVSAPSFAENERRLRARATESEGEIDERLDLARKQLEQADEFDYLVVNDDSTGPWRRFRPSSAAGSTTQVACPSRDLPTHRSASRKRPRALRARDRRRQARPADQQLPPPARRGTFDDNPPPLVESRSKNYLTMALEEIAEGKIKYKYK